MSLFCAAALVCGAFPFAELFSIQPVETAEAAVEADGYASFANGSTYTFTDYDKFDTYRNAVYTDNTYNSTGDDTTTVEVVKTATNRGSQQNPYVINSYETWDKFATEMSVSSGSPTNWGDGKYYVLACDLDFDASKSPTVRPKIMTTFAGTFYGLGHTLKNYHVTNNTTSSGTGLFRWSPSSGSKTAVITDLSLDNFSIKGASEFTGGFFGLVKESTAITILNCHIAGSIDSSTTVDRFVAGGFIGCCYQQTAANFHGRIYLYRCSSKITVTASMKTVSKAAKEAVGGMVGGVWDYYSLYCYDCYGELDITVSNSGSGTLLLVGGGAIAGWVCADNSTYTGGRIDVVRCAGKVRFTKGTGSMNTGFGILFTLSDLGTNTNLGKIYVRDCYIYGWQGNTGNSVGYTCYPWFVAKSSSSTYKSSAKNEMEALRVYYTYDNNVTPWSPGTAAFPTNNTSGYNGTYVSPGSIWTTSTNGAQHSDSNLNSSIWENRSVLGESYSYTIENSPVRNRAFNNAFAISFYNLKKSGSNNYTYEPITKAAVNYAYTTTSETQDLGADPTAPKNHVFKGWTLDKTGATAPVRTLDITDLYGNVKVYAVWELTGITSSLTQSGGTLNAATNTYEAESGGAGIRLTANVSVPSDAVAPANLSVEYTWQKEYKDTTDTGNTIHIGDQSKNGTYSFRWKVKDTTMPLASAEGSCADTMTLEITGKSLKMRTFQVTSPAYAGAPLSSITAYTLVMVDSSGNTVSGTPKWRSDTVTIKEGTHTYQLDFTPNDKNTYKPATVDVEITSVPLELTFAIDKTVISNADLVVEIDYGQPYSARDIVDMFEAAYVKKLGEDATFETTFNGRTPELDGTLIDDYNTGFPSGFTAPKTIAVTLAPAKDYTVTLDSADGSPVKTLKANWNHLVPEPATPIRDADYRFDGWFFTDSTGTEREWIFKDDGETKADRVTGDITLTAKWTQIIITLDRIEVTTNNNPFEVEALTKIADLGITVTAVYTSSDSTTPITKTIPLKVDGADGYTVRVDRKTVDEVHVGDASLEVSYNGKTATIPMTVLAIRLNEGKIHFETCVKEYTGLPQTVDTLSIKDLPVGIKEHVTAIDFAYSQNGKTVTSVVNQGTYDVTATFKLDSKDYELASVLGTFIISPPRLLLTVSWNVGTYLYDGTPQHPSATLTATDTNGNPVTLTENVQYTYKVVDSGNAVNNGIDAGSYMVIVELADSLKTQYKFDSGKDRHGYQIGKCKVAKPTPLDMDYVYDGSEKVLQLNGFESFMQFTADSKHSATDAGTYVAKVELDRNHEWNDSGSVALINWTVEKAKITKPTFDDVDDLTYDGYEQPIADEIKLYGFDESKMTISGDFEKKDAGDYTAFVTPNSNYVWSNNTSDPVSVKWTINKAPLTVIWADEDTYEKNGTTRFSPKVVGFELLGDDSFDEVADASLVQYDSGANKSAVGSYIVKISKLKTDWAKNYEIEDLGKGYRIIPTGADPDSADNPIVPDVTAPDPFNPPANGSGSGSGSGNGSVGGNGSTDGGAGDGGSSATVSELLPIILSGVSLVLIVTFAFMTVNYASAAKHATQKAKGLAQMTYSFAPAGLLVLGLTASNWWIVAGVLMGCALVMAIVTFIFRSKKVKALALVDEENTRLAAEKEAQAREEQRREAQEEQRRHDNEFKMMFAAMQQSSQQPQVVQPQLQLADIQNLITSTVSALLPGIQQAMALPPAQGDAEYYSRINAETEELRAQMAQQQQMLNQLLQNQQAPRPDDELRAQMAQQQELLNQVLQNQQAQAQAQQAYYEEEYPNPFAASDNPAVSLEDSYGRLDDERKRFYYEIGAFIMERPNVMQNDGKYAVLFKYRNRTLFKLTIRDDAPILTYVENGVLVEQRVASADELEYAKQIMNQSFAMVDRGY